MCTIFISDHTSHQTLYYKTQKLKIKLSPAFQDVLRHKVIVLKILLCDPGIAHRQPLLIVASSSASHSPVHVRGSV